MRRIIGIKAKREKKERDAVKPNTLCRLQPANVSFIIKTGSDSSFF
jgi:hypothetical protein